MKVSSKTDYALRTVLELARAPANEVVRVASISQRRHIPRKFLEQILATLKHGGIVGSRRGARGGYYLLRPAAKVSLFDVVSLMDHGLCRESTHAMRHLEGESDPFAEVWRDLDAYVKSALDGVSIQDMLERSLAEESDANRHYVI